MVKPNQVIDEITNVIYPPAEAIIPQLATIRAVATSTMKVYDSTKDIHSIFPNLDMMQSAIDYLRGMPLPDELKPLPEDLLNPIFSSSTENIKVVKTLNRDGEYNISILGTDIKPVAASEELFGDITNVIEMNLQLPVTCGITYLIAQENQVLEHYKDDPNVIYYEPDKTWIKEKEYNVQEDILDYAFLLPEGRSNVKISIYADYQEPIIFNITSHLHFIEEEPVPQPPYKGVKLTAAHCHVTLDNYNDGVTTYTVEGTNLNPDYIPNPDLFGNLDFNAVELKLHIPVECFKSYRITQYNSVLEHFAGKDDIYEDPDRGFYKDKEYMTTTDDFIDYSFLAKNGRNTITIYLMDEKGTIWKYIINAHIHFKGIT